MNCALEPGQFPPIQTVKHHSDWHLKCTAIDDTKQTRSEATSQSLSLTTEAIIKDELSPRVTRVQVILANDTYWKGLKRIRVQNGLNLTM